MPWKISSRRGSGATIAAWWTILVGVIFLVLQWILYLVFMSAHPAWLLWLCGPSTSWPFVQTVWFWAAALFQGILVDAGSDCSLVDVLVEEITRANASAVMALSPASRSKAGGIGYLH